MRQRRQDHVDQENDRLKEDRAKQQEMEKQFYDQYVEQSKLGGGSSIFDMFHALDEQNNLKNPKKKKKQPRFTEDQKQKYADLGDLDAFHVPIHWGSPKHKTGGKTKKKQQASSSKSSVTTKPLQDLCKSVDVGALKAVVTDAKASYANNFEFQFKKVAEHLEEHFAHSEEKHNETGRSDAPLCWLAAEPRQVLSDWLETVKDPPLATFLFFLLETMLSISDVHVGNKKVDPPATSGQGLRIFVQLIVNHRPGAFILAIPSIQQTYFDYDAGNINMKVIESDVVPFFVWVFSLLPSSQYSLQMALVFQFLFPVVLKPHQSPAHEIIFQYLDHLLQVMLCFLRMPFSSFACFFFGSQSKQKPVIDEKTAVNAYEQMMMVKFGDTPQGVNKKLQKVLDVMFRKDFLFSDNGSNRFFRMLLSHAASNTSNIRDHALSELLHLFKVNSAVFDYWATIHHKNVAQSCNLLTYMRANWQEHSRKINAEKLLNAIDNIQKVDTQLLNGKFKDPSSGTVIKSQPSKQFVKEISACESACDALQKTVISTPRSSSSAGGVVFSLVLSAAAAAGGYYVAMNCCQLDFCKSNDILMKYFQC